MFSVENFYFVLYTNLLQSTRTVGLSAYYFYPFGSTEAADLTNRFDYNLVQKSLKTPLVLFYDQEPLVFKNVHRLTDLPLNKVRFCKILANSEHSQVKKDICKAETYVDWYYFFHGFAALDWYKNYQYLPKLENQFTKVFISLNRLSVNDRSYRLQLVALMLEKKIVDKGIVSLSLNDHGYGSWQTEVASRDSQLTTKGKLLVNKHIGALPGSLVVDHDNPQGNLSAMVSLKEYKMYQNAFLHVVSETVFFHKKLHLTEKIFKPIISRRPFVLVAAPGNLAYFKSYGFKTFDRWIDESYDDEQDNDKRLEMIATEIEKLCKLSTDELKQMHKEMQEILDYNFDHFYGQFKEIIVDELLNNFNGAVAQWNHGRIDVGQHVDISVTNFDEVRARLLR